MTAHDWTYFIRKMYFNATKEDLFSMWVNKDKITKFWLLDAKYFNSEAEELGRTPQKGDTYDWTFASNFNMKGKILEVDANKKFKFTFGKSYQDSDENVIVTLLFDGNKDESWIELIQENIGTDEFGKVHYHLSCQLGWLHALVNLKSVVDHGVDLRPSDPSRYIENVGISILRENSSFS